jgi:hypothetical protein
VSVISSVRLNVLRLGCDELFTTSDVLHCGSRHSVDQALHIMVKRGELVRWANGVFSRSRSSQPTPVQVVKLKSRVRGDHAGIHTAISGPLYRKSGQIGCSPTFLTIGSTSSFQFGALRIYLRHACLRRLLAMRSEPSVHRACAGGPSLFID